MSDPKRAFTALATLHPVPEPLCPEQVTRWRGILNGTPVTLMSVTDGTFELFDDAELPFLYEQQV